MKPEVHKRACKPGECVPGCDYYVAPEPKTDEHQPDLIDSCQDAVKMLWDVASAPEPEPDKAEKAGGNFGRVLRLLGVR